MEFVDVTQDSHAIVSYIDNMSLYIMYAWRDRFKEPKQ